MDAYGKKEQTIESMINDFDAANNWLKNVGVNISPGRFQSYRKKIDNALRQGKFFSPDAYDSDLLWAIAELHDLLEIYNNLKYFDCNVIKRTLWWLKKGPPLLAEEPRDGGKIHGRNYAFELYTASRFLRAGLDVSYQSKADINLTIMDTLIHVECKRSLSENNLEALIEKAINQIDNSCRNNSTHRGIVALSLSKYIWSVQQELSQGNVADEKNMRSLLHPVSQLIADEIRSRYSSSSDKVIGLIFHYKVPFYRKSDGFPACVNRFSFVPFSAHGSVNKAISDKMSEHFKQSMYVG